MVASVYMQYRAMNDAILAEQLRKTGNLMDLLNDEAWVQAADADHASEEGPVKAGLGLLPYVEFLKNASPEILGTGLLGVDK